MKKNEIVIIRPRVSEKKLKKYVFFSETLVRPFEKSNRGIEEVHTGIILKLPVTENNMLSDGENWKRLLDNKSNLKVGDKVLYTHSTRIIIEGETLHLVSWFMGKLL